MFYFWLKLIYKEIKVKQKTHEGYSEKLYFIDVFGIWSQKACSKLFILIS